MNTDHNSENGIELFLLDAWRSGDTERLIALSGSVADSDTEIDDNKYSMATVVR